jgi:hypothetical protein
MKMLFSSPTGDVELYHGPFGVWGTVFYGTDGIVAVNRGKIAVWKGTGLVKPTKEIRAALQDVSFMKGKIVAESVGKDYGTDAVLKKDNRLDAALTLLKERGCKSIKFMCLVAAPEGVDAVSSAHPDVEIYTASLDRGLNEKAYIVPGLGDAGDRIFGTL